MKKMQIKKSIFKILEEIFASVCYRLGILASVFYMRNTLGLQAIAIIKRLNHLTVLYHAALCGLIIIAMLVSEFVNGFLVS